MADIREWIKGISFFIFVTLLFYFLWSNVFSNILSFVGGDVFGIGSGANTSIAIMKTMGWVSFVFLYLSVSTIYLIFSIIIGAKGEVKTRPIEFLKAIGVWSIITPFLTFIYGLVYYLQTTLDTATSSLMDNASSTLASNFSWVLALICLSVMIILPFIFILKGYGIDIWGGNKEKIT